MSELNRLSELFSTANTVDEIISLVLENINKIIPADEWTFATIDEGKNTYKLFLSEERSKNLFSEDEGQIERTQPLVNTIVSRAAKDKRTIISLNCQTLITMMFAFWANQQGIRTVMSTPIMVGASLLGILTRDQNSSQPIQCRMKTSFKVLRP